MFRLLFLFNIPRPSGLIPWNTGCPWILEIFHHLWSTKIPLAARIDCISLIPLASLSGSQECPVSVIESWGVLFDSSRSGSARIFIPFLSNSMSLNVDMKMIRSLNFSIVMRFPSRSYWILRRRSNAVAPANFSTRSQSALHLVLAVLWMYGTSLKLTLVLPTSWLHIPSNHHTRNFWTNFQYSRIQSSWNFQNSSRNSGPNAMPPSSMKP